MTQMSIGSSTYGQIQLMMHLFIYTRPRRKLAQKLLGLDHDDEEKKKILLGLFRHQEVRGHQWS